MIKSNQANIEKPKKSNFDLISTLFKLSGLLLFGFYVYGYGAVIGYAGYFGIPQSSLHSSPTDLLGIASETFTFQIIDFYNNGGFFSFFLSLIKSTFGYIAVLIFIFVCALFLFHRFKINENQRASIKKIFKFIDIDRQEYSKETSFISFLRLIGFSFFSWILALAGLSAFVFAIFFVFSLFLLAPITGYQAASRHAEIEIIRPTKCSSLQTREQAIAVIDKQKAETLAGVKHQPTEAKASCVKVTYADDKGTKTIVGRSVIAGSDYILIYETNGKATRIPLKAAVVEAADDDVLKEVELQKNKIAASKAQ